MKTIKGRLFFLLGSLGMSLFVSGCAEVIIQKDGMKEGYDVYRPEPYLLVFKQTTSTTAVTENKAAAGAGGGGGGGDQTPNQGGGGGGAKDPNAGGATSPEGLTGPGITVIWLPNYSERYRVRSKAGFLSKAGADFTIRDGWMLTGVTDQSDNTALLTAAQGVLSSALGSASSAAKTTKGPDGQAPPPGGKTTTTTTIQQDWELYKFLFDKDGNFYGLTQVTPEDNTIEAFRDKAATATLSPQKAPTYRGDTFKP
jgi:hypothetical protein